MFAALVLTSFAGETEGAGSCSNEIKGTAGNDVLTGTPASDRMLGLAGNDKLSGASGGDCLDGGPGGDTLLGDAGPDRLIGGDSGDTLAGGDGRDSVEGGAGADSLSGGAQRDSIDGGAGNDDVNEVGDGYHSDETLDVGTNVIDTGSGRDTVNAANGRRDTIRCGPDDDKVVADRDDKLIGCEHRTYLISPFPQINPSSGNRRRSFMVRFRSLSKINRKKEFFSITVKGPGRCRKIISNSVGVTYHRNGVVRYRLRPFAGKGRPAKRWCRGRYRGKADFVAIEKPSCKVKVDSKPNRRCTKSRSIGEFSFRVR